MVSQKHISSSISRRRQVFENIRKRKIQKHTKRVRVKRKTEETYDAYDRAMGVV